MLYLFMAILSGLGPFFDVTRTATLPSIAQGKSLLAANALTSTTWAAMLTVGSALGRTGRGLPGKVRRVPVERAQFRGRRAVRVPDRHPRRGGRGTAGPVPVGLYRGTEVHRARPGHAGLSAGQGDLGTRRWRRRAALRRIRRTGLPRGRHGYRHPVHGKRPGDTPGRRVHQAVQHYSPGSVEGGAS